MVGQSLTSHFDAPFARVGLIRMAILPPSAEGLAGARTRSQTMPKETPAQQAKVHKVLHEAKEGTLKSGSGQKVTSHKQAVAIALREAHVPKKGSQTRH